MTVSVALRHAFPAFALDVAFDAPAGVTVLFGRSGSGKTSVINAVAGLLRPDHARITIDGRMLADTQAGLWLPPHRRNLGYIFQEGRLFPHLSVEQNLTYGARFAPRGAPGESLGRVVDLLGIGHLLRRRPGALSGGEKQRVAIGRALLAKPRLILADEPLAALDETRKAEILPYFERLRDEVAVPILYVSHAPAEVARLATSVVALQEGRVVRQGPAAEVLGDPAITPLGVGEAGALISARLVAHHDDGLSEVEAGGVRLFLPALALPLGADLRLRIPAQEVILARDRPEGLSALNIVPGVVHAVRLEPGAGALVSVDTGAGRILARLTQRSVAALGLGAGRSCHAVIKAIGVAPGHAGPPR